MTEKEIIKALKENEKAYHFMKPEMQAWAIVHKKDMRCLWDSGKRQDRYSVDCTNRTYRLRSDYQEEPERIEIEIKPDKYGDYCIYIKGLRTLYTNAPALVPQKGFIFIGFMFAEFDELVNHNMVYWESKQSGWAASNFRSNLKPIHPIAAIYERKIK